jgi:NTP pyrophosphatase (non-canonical NTP hydrolase)
MTIKDFQQLIAKRYQKRDNARGTPKTFMWFIEEVGELATALADEKASKKQKEEEFADIFAWLCTLANINDVDIEKACINKYHKKQPKGFK